MNFNFFPDIRCGDDSFVGLIVGSKGSGKTWLLMDLLKTVWLKRFNLIVIVSPTFSLQEISNEIIDGRGIVIFSEFKLCIIEELVELQKDKIFEKQYAKEIQQTPPELLPGPGYLGAAPAIPEDHHVLLVFDDIGSLGREGKLGIQMANLAFLVRHYKISIIELAQRATLASTSLSSQADFWIFFAEQNPNERINIFKRIGFEDRKTFWYKFDRETYEIRSWIGVRKIAGRNYFFNIDGFVT
jgi:hypothetical protein